MSEVDEEANGLGFLAPRVARIGRWGGRAGTRSPGTRCRLRPAIYRRKRVQRASPHAQKWISHAQRVITHAQEAITHARRAISRAQQATSHAQRPSPHAQRPITRMQRPITCVRQAITHVHQALLVATAPVPFQGDRRSCSINDRRGQAHVMESIWNDLCHRRKAIPSPSWHGEVLSERERLVAEGDSI
jgi:hypothetical protein